ncbi:MAG: 6-phosphogluconolactonase [Acidimicrobiia bacterium]|nr:6-phosphogluconolactonase [Acidimicrobiia bacterium]
MPDTELVVAATLQGAVRWVADAIVGDAKAAMADHGSFHLCLAGGSTPRDLYALLSSPLWRTRVEWDRVHLYMGDERYVGAVDPRSNYRMIRETLVDRILVPPRNVHPIPTGGRDPEADAARYETVLRNSLPAGSGGVPRFDVVLLGLGNDGHTASLFPGSTAIDETQRLVVGVSPPMAPTPRITLTPPVINAAQRVIVLTGGALKAGALRHMLAEHGSPHEIPARVLDPDDGRLCVSVDLAACSELDAEPLHDGIVTIRL